MIIAAPVVIVAAKIVFELARMALDIMLEYTQKAHAQQASPNPSPAAAPTLKPVPTSAESANEEASRSFGMGMGA